VRLGLIALGGLRVVDPVLREMGLTLPGFADRGRTIAALPSLGLLTLAGLTPAEIDLEYVEVDELPSGTVVPGDFDAVAISSFSARIHDAYELADRYRALGVKVILGGLHVSARPDEAARHADAVVVGEGEPVWPRVARDLVRGRLEPRYDARPTPFDLADAPLPAFELLARRAANDPPPRYTVQTQRGCPWACDFCAASMRIAPRFVVKPVHKVVAEIRRLQELFDAPFVEFADDNTFANPEHGKRLLGALEPLGVRWFTETDISVADDPELVGRLRDAGCAQVLIGLESPSVAALAGVERAADWKARRVDRYALAVERLQQAGISVNGCFVLGLGPDPNVEVDAVLDFVATSGLHEVQVTVRTPFPGTPLYDDLEARGRLIAADDWDRCTLFDVAFTPEGSSVDALRSALHRATRELYSDDAKRARQTAFRRAIRRGVERGPRS
jgi:radical SAM superfamily enzyme YgiQ (UPF0313 family)